MALELLADEDMEHQVDEKGCEKEEGTEVAKETDVLVDVDACGLRIGLLRNAFRRSQVDAV